MLSTAEPGTPARGERMSQGEPTPQGQQPIKPHGVHLNPAVRLSKRWGPPLTACSSQKSMKMSQIGTFHSEEPYSIRHHRRALGANGNPPVSDGGVPMIGPGLSSSKPWIVQAVIRHSTERAPRRGHLDHHHSLSPASNLATSSPTPDHPLNFVCGGICGGELFLAYAVALHKGTGDRGQVHYIHRLAQGSK